MYLPYDLRLTSYRSPHSRADLFAHRKSGLEFTTATDGTSEWVRPEDVERFKRDGAALLGKEAQVNEGAISQVGAMYQQLKSREEAETSRGVAEAAEGEKLDSPSGCRCSLL